jgi:hypothetical protein
MAWRYEIRGSQNRLVEIRTGFATERQAREAGGRSKRMIDSMGYPNQETLSIVIREDHTALGRPPEPPPDARHGANLKYPWQQAVLDAFLEPHQENLFRKVNVAERAISARLLESDPFELDERIALGEALLALRRLMRRRAEPGNESNDKRDKKDIA